MTLGKGLRHRIVAVAVVAAIDLAVLCATAIAAPDGCQALYQRRNRDHCRAEVAQNQWPCAGLPVQDLQDLKNCATLFDYNSFPSAAAGSQPRTPSAFPKSVVEPTTSSPTPAAQTPPGDEQKGEVLPLKMIDVQIASREASRQASIERQRSLEQQRARVAAQLGVDPQVRDARPPSDAPAANGQVLQLYAELQRMQAESDRLSREISEQNEALEAARRQRAELEAKSTPAGPSSGEGGGAALGAALLAVGALILAALVGAILYLRWRQGAGGGDSTRVFSKRKISEGSTIIGAGAFKDCVLESADGPALLLVGSQLPERAGGIVVGRHGAQAQVIIDKPEISRRHARFTVRDGALAVEDLGSANGTSVDGSPVRAGERRIVGNGARIQFGPLAYTLRVAS